MDDKAFNEFLEHADQVVRTWPLWKQTLLGGKGKREEPREPVDNFKQVADCLRDENRVLKQTNESLRDESSVLKAANAGLRKEVAELRSATDQQHREICELNRVRHNLTARCDDLQQQKEALEVQLNTLRRAYDKAGEALLKHATDLESVRQQRDSFGQKFTIAVEYQDELLKTKQELISRLDAIVRIAESGWQE